jgi:hypothetical protein
MENPKNYKTELLNSFLRVDLRKKARKNILLKPKKADLNLE